MKHIGSALLTASLMAPAVAVAQSADLNVGAEAGLSARALQLEQLTPGFLAEEDVAAAADLGICAIAFLPGPADSFNISIELTNAAQQQLEVAIIDPFKAFGGQALLIESVFDLSLPPGGTIDVLYPDGAPAGPAVLDFISFDSRDSASFGLDPDRYDDPAFSVTVADMDGTEIEAAYSDGLRCAGELEFNPLLDASFAFLRQTSPTP